MYCCQTRCRGIFIIYCYPQKKIPGPMSKLFLVPTPIGNLGDITLRALEVLRTAGLILAEDTRTTKILLNHYNISVPLQSHHKFNEHKSVDSVCDKIENGTVVALVSDAGTPGISDPGFL